MSKIERFYNSETKQTHRFIPMFKRRYDNKVMGMTIDSDLNNWFYNGTPVIMKGQMVLVENKKRIGLTYKGEELYQLEKVYGGEFEQGIYSNVTHMVELSVNDGYDWNRI